MWSVWISLAVVGVVSSIPLVQNLYPSVELEGPVVPHQDRFDPFWLDLDEDDEPDSSRDNNVREMLFVSDGKKTVKKKKPWRSSRGVRHVEDILQDMKAVAAAAASEIPDEPKKSRVEKRYPPHLDPYNQYKFWMRSGECPSAEDGQQEFFCPSPDADDKWQCIDDYQLCDGMRNCPNGEDELPIHCLFYRVIQSHINVLTGRIMANSRVREG